MTMTMRQKARARVNEIQADIGQPGAQNDVDMANLRFREGWTPLAHAPIFGEHPTSRTLVLVRSDGLVESARNLSYDTGSGGGWTVPEGSTVDEIYEVGLVQTDPIRREATIISEGVQANTGIPVAIDNGQVGRIVGPGLSVATETDPSFGLRYDKPCKFASGQIKYPFELARDGGAKFHASIAGMGGNRNGRAQGAAFATGSGIGAPLGVCGQVDLGVTCASQTAPTIDEIEALPFSVDPEYWTAPGRSPAFMMHGNVYKYFRSLKDGNGRPLWETSGIWKFGRVVINNFFPSTFAAGQRLVWFGDWKSCVTIHDIDVRLVRYKETFTEADCEAVEAFHTADMVVVDLEAVKALQLAS